MRIASFVGGNGPTYGVVGSQGIFDLGARVDAPNLRSLLATDQLHSAAAGATATVDYALSDVEFLPVIPEPNKILCVGLNYRPHVEETGRDLPQHPLLFCRFSASQVGHERAIVRPRASEKYDFEGELAIIIGQPARHVREADALNYVAGYTAFNDGSIRDFQRHSTHFTAGKNFVASGAMGPWMVTADEISNPANLGLETRVSGALMQSANTADLIFSIAGLISYCSTFTQLLPGDVIATGTPGGVGYARKPPRYLVAGDTVEITIDEIGTLRNTVVDET